MKASMISTTRTPTSSLDLGFDLSAAFTTILVFCLAFDFGAMAHSLREHFGSARDSNHLAPASRPQHRPHVLHVQTTIQKVSPSIPAASRRHSPLHPKVLAVMLAAVLAALLLAVVLLTLPPPLPVSVPHLQNCSKMSLTSHC